ncbi:MAG: PaaI family thioesterase [Hyphomicrobiales bacterium]
MDIHDMTGLEQLKSMIEQGTPPAYAKLLDFRIAEVAEGRAVFEGEPSEQHYNPHGVVHGGYAASILDSCMGCAVQTVLGRGVGYTTIELKINYVRAMTRDTGTVRAIGTSIHSGRRVATAEAKLVDCNDRLLAHGSTTCLILSSPAGS